jgi:hypothetical protein
MIVDGANGGRDRGRPMSNSKAVRLLLCLGSAGCVNAPSTAGPRGSTAPVLVGDGGVCRAQDASLPDGGAAAPYIQCDESCDCPANLICTRNWNTGILYQLEALGLDDQFGHCFDPRATSAIDGIAIQRDLDALEQLWEEDATGWANLDNGAIPYHLPDRAEVRLERELTVRFRINLRGNGAIFRVKNNVNAIVLSEGTNYSRLEDLSIHAFSDTQSNSGIGIKVTQSAVRLQNIRIDYMGTGIEAIDTGPNNVSIQRWRDITISDSDHYGVFLNGADASNNFLEGVSIVKGSEVGLYDGGQLGSTFVGLHLNQNATAIQTDSSGSSTSTYVGTYVGADALTFSAASTLMTSVGGQLSARDEFIGDRVGAQNSRLVFEDRVPVLGNSEDRHIMRVEIPSVFQGGTGNRMSAIQYHYIYQDCDPMNTSDCVSIPFPLWHLDRRLGIDPGEDAWEIRSNQPSSGKIAFGWTSASDGTSVEATVGREPICDYVSSCP